LSKQMAELLVRENLVDKNEYEQALKKSQSSHEDLIQYLSRN